MRPKIILYIAMSKDGYIASENDNLDFLNKYHIPNEDYGYTAFMERVGCVIVGRRTYDKVLNMGFPYHENKMVYVLTRDNKRTEKMNLIFINQDIKSLIHSIQLEKDEVIYCDGGAEIAHVFLKENLIDEIIISIVPEVLRSGTELFRNGEIPSNFKLEAKLEFSSGLIQYHFLNEYNQTV